MSSPKLAGALLISAAAAFGQTYTLVPSSLSIQASTVTGPGTSLSTGCTANPNPTTSTGPNVLSSQASGTFLNLTFSLTFTCTGSTQAGLTPATGTGSATISFPTSIAGSPNPDGTVLDLTLGFDPNNNPNVWYEAHLNAPFFQPYIVYDFNLKQPGAYQPTAVNPSLGPTYGDYTGCGPNDNDAQVSATGCPLVYIPLSNGVATYYFAIMVESTVLFNGSVTYTTNAGCPGSSAIAGFVAADMASAHRPMQRNRWLMRWLLLKSRPNAPPFAAVTRTNLRLRCGLRTQLGPGLSETARIDLPDKGLRT